MRSYAMAAIVFSLSVGLGLEALRHSRRITLTGLSSPSVMEADVRTPAAIRKVSDYSHLVGAAFENAVHNHLLNEAKVVYSPDGPGIQFHHFVLKGAGGEKVFACDQYDTLEVHLAADGILESGMVPTMVVETPCRFSQNVNQLDPIWIPVKELTGTRPGNADLSIHSLPQPLRVQMRDMPPFWPGKWNVVRVRFVKSQNPGEALSLDLGPRSSFKQLSVYFPSAEK